MKAFGSDKNMKKKLAILLASLSLCACSFIGCSDDDKKDDNGEQNVVKAAEGEKCGDSAEGKECKDDTLECVKKGGEGEDADEFICKKKDQGVEKAAEGEKCGDSAEGKECKDDTLECVKKGGEGEDAEELICKKKEQGAEKAGKGQACGGSIECDGDNLSCDGICKLKADEICETGDACVTGYECKAGEDPDTALKCRATGGGVQKAGKGQACGGSIECDGDNLSCDGICKLKADEICETGDACVTGYECKAGEDPDTALKCRTAGGSVITDKAGKGEICSTLSTNGKVCDEGLICWKRGGSEANADDKICKIKAGGDCSATGDAVYCIDGTSCIESGGNKTCEKPAELNADCVALTGCGGDFYCDKTTNSCQPKLANGEICFQDNTGDDASLRNDRCTSGHCEGKKVAGSDIPNNFEWKCADKIAAGEACTRLLTAEGASFVYTSVCADEDRICRPETYFEGIHGYGFDWEEGKCLPYLLKINEPCNTPHDDITQETECDWGWERHLICHDTGNGNFCKVANGGACSKNESCASGNCEKTGSASNGTCRAVTE